MNYGQTLLSWDGFFVSMLLIFKNIFNELIANSKKLLTFAHSFWGRSMPISDVEIIKVHQNEDKIK